VGKTRKEKSEELQNPKIRTAMKKRRRGKAENHNERRGHGGEIGHYRNQSNFEEVEKQRRIRDGSSHLTKGCGEKKKGISKRRLGDQAAKTRGYSQKVGSRG